MRQATSLLIRVFVLVGIWASTSCASASSAAVAPAPTPTASAPASAGSPAPSLVPTTVATPAHPEDPVAWGEEIFQKTAGGVGCQLCHGRNAQGLLGPDIRGKTPDDIKAALTAVSNMAFIQEGGISDEEIRAVAAYLGSLRE